MSVCPVCGAGRTPDGRITLIERGGLLYEADTIGTLHGCTAPDAEMPDVEGEPMLLDEATGLLVPMDAA